MSGFVPNNWYTQFKTVVSDGRKIKLDDFYVSVTKQLYQADVRSVRCSQLQIQDENQELDSLAFYSSMYHEENRNIAKYLNLGLSIADMRILATISLNSSIIYIDGKLIVIDRKELLMHSHILHMFVKEVT